MKDRELPEPVAKVPGIGAQALAGEIIEALLADEKDGGYDLTAGMFGRHFSRLVRRWAAAEWATSPPLWPLTEDQRFNLIVEHLGPSALTGGKMTPWEIFMLGIAACEAAHGITGEQK